MTERLIVIGGGGAGTAAATIAKRLNPDLHVTLFTEFPDIAYSPCGIPFVHGREIDKFESLFLSTVERYVEDGLDERDAARRVGDVRKLREERDLEARVQALGDRGRRGARATAPDDDQTLAHGSSVRYSMSGGAANVFEAQQSRWARAM